MKPTVTGLAAARASVGARAAARPPARIWRRVSDASIMGIPSCPRRRPTISDDGEPIPEPASGGQADLDVLFQQITLGHEPDGGGAHTGQILLARAVALFDRRPGIAALRALFSCAGERQRGAGERQPLLGAADLGMAQVPSCE